MRISIASDHGGVELKKEIYNHLKEKGIEVTDLSPINDSNDDYPTFAYVVGKSIQEKKADLGILVCRSGIGLSIAANKMQSVYCARITNFSEVELSCNHNGINCMSLAGDLMSIEEAIKSVDIFIESERLDSERHQRRFQKIIEIESRTYNGL